MAEVSVAQISNDFPIAGNTTSINHDYQSWGPKFIEGSLEAKLPTIWSNGKAEVGRVKEEKKR